MSHHPLLGVEYVVLSENNKRSGISDSGKYDVTDQSRPGLNCDSVVPIEYVGDSQGDSPASQSETGEDDTGNLVVDHYAPDLDGASTVPWNEDAFVQRVEEGHLEVVE